MLIDIKPKTIIVVLAIYYLFGFFVESFNVFLMIFISYILYCSLNPFISFLESKKYKRPTAILLTFLVIIILFFSIFGIVSTQLLGEFSKLATNFPIYLNSFIDKVKELYPALDDNINIQYIQSEFINNGQISSLLTNLSTVVSESLKFSINSFLVFMISAFMLSQSGKDTRESQMIYSFLGEDVQRFNGLRKKIEHKLSQWVNGQLLLCTSAGVFNTFAFIILGIPYALPIGIIAFILEALPNIGPIIVTVIGFGIVFGAKDILTAIIYLIAVLLFQQLQALFIAPKVIEKTVGLNPLVTLLAVTVVANMPHTSLGLVFITIPIISVLQIILEEYIHSKKKI